MFGVIKLSKKLARGAKADGTDFRFHLASWPRLHWKAIECRALLRISPD